MATVESNAFEIERRGFQWSMNNTLDDGQSSLLYDSNPNNTVSGNTAGESKLYSLLPGATYFQSTGEYWIKTGSPNKWALITTSDVLDTRLSALSADMQAGKSVRVNMTNLGSLPPSEVLCFDTTKNRTAKVIVSARTSTKYLTTELLIGYYEIQGTVTITGVNHTQYASLGDSDLIEFEPVLRTGEVFLKMTPTLMGIVADIHITLI